MATYVLLLKYFEDDEKVIYRFGPNEQSMGKIELNKRTNRFEEVDPLPNSPQANRFYFDRAAQRLARCVVKEGGQFADRLTFES